MDGAGPRALGAAAGAGTARKPVGNRPSGSDAEAADQPLVADGLLERRPYRASPVRHAYVLTERGRSLRPVIVALVDFTTGREAEPVVVGARTGERLDDSEAYVFTAGPAASAVMRGRYEEWGRA
ncbi:hypothetical protein C0Q97_29230 [Streptomyces albidoflavus]|uniref:HTH hxlR-type domain-containing protein n=1 Tax=Streptomyces albidoflavus TaxID=1886 RepID=A0AA37C4C3_9ACTN|nr:helix-turn-helix transcriptional regulator [Streptomyces sp. S-2]RZE49128.1 hypothetical protein C0Q97_29230 [Streptomyces albidoflavus]GHI49869.1 hypothetical protein ScoT_60430 [Streptomyces albidoflavus]